MSVDDPRLRKLHDLLPEVYRKRDDPANGEPLRYLLEVLGGQAAVIEENLALLYDDLFVETAEPWVLPYIAELIGLRGLPGDERFGMTPRAEVANTIGYRRRMGTAGVLEQVAHDVTGWPARAVEYFELLVGTQYMNHVRPHSPATINVRHARRLEWVGTPFERLRKHDDLPHVIDVRRVTSGRGRYNIPNIGIHLWRLRPYGVSRSPAGRVSGDDGHRFFFSPLSTDTQLYTLPTTEDAISQMAEPVNVPLPISHSMLQDALASYYGNGLSVYVEGVGRDRVVVCDLGDVDGGWAHVPAPGGAVAIDPVLGRLAFGEKQEMPPLVSFHYGFSADIGGGEYSRVSSFAGIRGETPVVSTSEPAAHASIDDALTALDEGSGTVEIGDNGRYAGPDTIEVQGRLLELRSASKYRPMVVLESDLRIDGDSDGELTINGLVIVGGALRVSGLRRLRLRHCTLVPGGRLRSDGEPAGPGAVSLFVESGGVDVELDSCIVGGLRAHVDSRITAANSIIDAGERGTAYKGFGDVDAGGEMSLQQCTVLGRIHARTIDVASNSIFLAQVAEGQRPIDIDRTQTGCIRFSYVPAGSRTPRRFHCLPGREADAIRFRPVLTSTRYTDPGYCQLDRRTPDEIYRGADDESEMGVFHDLYQSRREQYLVSRLRDYVRFGLETGIFFGS